MIVYKSILMNHVQGNYDIHFTQGGKSVSYTLTVIILKPPSIVIEEYGPFIESETVEDIAKCIAKDGKPPGAIVTWGNYGTASTEGIDESVLSFKPNRRFNGVPLTCTVNHEALTAPISDSFVPNIEFPPGQPQILTVDPDCDADVNNILQLKCVDNQMYPANPS